MEESIFLLTPLNRLHTINYISNFITIDVNLLDFNECDTGYCSNLNNS